MACGGSRVRVPLSPPLTFAYVYVYILQSEKNGRYYVGYTNNLERRFSQHDAGKVQSTKYLRPLTLVYNETYEDGTTARRRERWIKTQKSRILIEQLIHGGVGRALR